MIGIAEIIVGGVVSVISTLIIIQRLFVNKIKMMELNKQYEIDMLKLKKREGRKDKKLAASIKTKPPKTAFELLKGVNINKLKPLIEMVQGEDYEPAETGNNLIDGLGDFISNNPDIVSGFLDGLNKKKGETEETNENNDNLLFS